MFKLWFYWLKWTIWISCEKNVIKIHWRISGVINWQPAAYQHSALLSLCHNKRIRLTKQSVGNRMAFPLKIDLRFSNKSRIDANMVESLHFKMEPSAYKSRRTEKHREKLLWHSFFNSHTFLYTRILLYWHGQLRECNEKKCNNHQNVSKTNVHWYIALLLEALSNGSFDVEINVSDSN